MTAKVLLIVLVLSQYSSNVFCENWALIVAGSRSYFNYRHQSDICHAYNLLRNHGIPESNIIVMHVNDIAYNENNPLPGRVFNRIQGENVYHNIPVDYTGRLVGSKNFINILLGRRNDMRGIGSGRVIQSTEKDNIFVNFVDHGSIGLLAFPWDSLTAAELNETLTAMHKERKYQNMLIYVEACFSGSMFKKILPNNTRIYVTTAANSLESSYACYYDESIFAYLGDEYSVNWMEDSDLENLNTRTIREQFLAVKNRTLDSHVSEYGDKSVSNLPLSAFFGSKPWAISAKSSTKKFTNKITTVPSVDAGMKMLELQSMHGDLKSRLSAIKEMDSIRRKRQSQDILFREFAAAFQLDINKSLLPPQGYHRFLKCHSKVVKTFEANCFILGQSPYSLKYGAVFFHICNLKLVTDDAVRRITEFCNHKGFADFSM